MVETTRKKNEKGITLIEQVTVLAIIGILSSLAFVGPEFVSNERVMRITREMLGDIQRLRQDAMTKANAVNSRGFGIRFVDQSSYVIFEFDDCNNDAVYSADGCPEGREEANIITGERENITTRKLESSSNIGLSVNDNIPDNNIIIFDKLGIPREDDWTLWNNGSLVVEYQESGSVTERCITIGLNRIREGVWYDNNCQEQ